jgi:hypothetical protein
MTSNSIVLDAEHSPWLFVAIPPRPPGHDPTDRC